MLYHRHLLLSSLAIWTDFVIVKQHGVSWKAMAAAKVTKKPTKLMQPAKMKY